MPRAPGGGLCSRSERCRHEEPLWCGRSSLSRLFSQACDLSHVRPAFLPLFSGKYLNVVRECGHDVTCPVAKEVIYTLKERAYVEQIEKAFSYASKVLLDFLLEERELVAHLRCALPGAAASAWCVLPTVCSASSSGVCGTGAAARASP